MPTDVRIYSGMTIEETALCTQVDFANKSLGGGVLREGSVQEEIRFLMCPELLVGKLFMRREMKDKEAISIVGAYVYSSYVGYGRNLRWKELERRHARQNDESHRDGYGRLRVETIAIDATPFSSDRPLLVQFQEVENERDIKKATAGFCAQQGKDFDDIPIVSGLWGCGAFNGQKLLKFLQQVIAAGIADRPLVFCTFGDEETEKRCKSVLEKIRDKVWRLADVHYMLESVEEAMCRLKTADIQSADDFLFNHFMKYEKEEDDGDSSVYSVPSDPSDCSSDESDD